MRSEQLKADWMTITPDLAKELLENYNVRNRPLCEERVQALALEMERGTWKTNGDTIRFAGNRLLDGQHRLSAVVLADKPITALVVIGLDEDVFSTIDVGKKRTPADTLAVLGESNTIRLAAALALLEAYLEKGSPTKTRCTNARMLQILEKYPAMRGHIQSGLPSKNLVPPAVLDVCHYLFSQKDPVAATKFCEDLCRGVGLGEDDPVYVLRERLLKNSLSRAKLDRWYVLAMCIKTWNARRSARSIRYLSWKDGDQKAEQFPVVQ